MHVQLIAHPHKKYDRAIGMIQDSHWKSKQVGSCICHHRQKVADLHPVRVSHLCVPEDVYQMPAAHTQGQAWPVMKASGDDRIEMGFVQVVRKKRKLVLIEDSGALENVQVTGGYQQKQRLPAKFRLSEETVAKGNLADVQTANLSGAAAEIDGSELGPCEIWFPAVLHLWLGATSDVTCRQRENHRTVMSCCTALCYMTALHADAPLPSNWHSTKALRAAH